MDKKITYKEFLKIRDGWSQKISKECGVFFAFSNEQFEKNRPTGIQVEDLCSLGGGGYMPVANAKKWHDSWESSTDDLANIFQKQVSADEAIIYELNNHEYCYSGDIEPTYSVLSPYGVTMEDVKRVASGGEWKEFLIW